MTFERARGSIASVEWVDRKRSWRWRAVDGRDVNIGRILFLKEVLESAGRGDHDGMVFVVQGPLVDEISVAYRELKLV